MQIIDYPPHSFVAVCVPKKIPFDPLFLKAELSLLCRETSVRSHYLYYFIYFILFDNHFIQMKIPPYFAFLHDFPRTKTRVQKFKLREMVAEGKIELI